MFDVRFTARVVNRDTEEEFNGWVSPSWNRYALYSEKEDVQVESFDTLEEAEKHIEDTIGSYVKEQRGNYYAEDEDMNYESGEHWLRAGHIEER
jgi:hypothetical protein